MTRCTGHNRRGEQCGRHATPGRTKCRLHGGESLAGVASPSLKHGRYSKYLPAHMTATYEQALADEQRLFDLSDDLALMESRVASLLQDIANGQAVTWGELEACVNAYERAKSKGERSEQDRQVQRIAKIVDGGVRETEVWKEIETIVEGKRKLAASEMKLRTDRGQLIPIETVEAVMRMMLTVIRANVYDRATLEAIQRHWRALATRHPNMADEIEDTANRLTSGEGESN